MVPGEVRILLVVCFRGEDNKAVKSHSLIEKFNGLDVMVMN